MRRGEKIVNLHMVNSILKNFKKYANEDQDCLKQCY